MGVPKFFRWCAERYPSVITPFKDSPPPVDNLYLDVNGIIHNCTHPNDVDATRRAPTEKEMIQAMFTYLEKLFNAVQPRRHFVIAVDGVAPRAKMNQQRQRRYRAGYEMMVAREEALQNGEDVPEEKDVFDSNCITPGTPFMVRVSKEFQYFVSMKLSTDPAWQNVKVIFSGHDTPGEGEHKIVDFVRRRKMQPDYNPNETHCMYGLDADLVMLALATHEPHFVLLREVVTFGPGSRKERERQEEDEAKGLITDKSYHKADEFVLLHIGVLRDYLQLEVKEMMKNCGGGSNFDLERVIDDFVFMCFFIGNDFLPTLPTVGINDGSMAEMLSLYVEQLLSKNKFLTCEGNIDWRNAELWLNELGKLEYETLRRRQQEEEEYARNRARFDRSHEAETTTAVPITSIVEFKQRYYGDKHQFQGGWDATSAEMQELRLHYVEGLTWVMRYYYEGVPSWKWYFPHYYAPMASDLVNLVGVAAKIHFDLGTPFLPHQQLLAVLPPMSYLSMPKAYWPLLKSPTSPLQRYMPDHIVIDREGARAPWEGIVLIPFIEEAVLLAAYKSVQQNVSEEDNQNNRNGPATQFYYNEKMEPYVIKDAMFGDLKNVMVARAVYELPHIDRFLPALCKGVLVGDRQLEGFASLQSKRLLLSTALEAGVVSIFGRPTKKPSLLMKLEDSFRAKSADEVARLVGREVLVGFPHYKRARVSAVSDAQKMIQATYAKDGTFSGTNIVPHNRDESNGFVKEADTHGRYLKSQLGIDAGDVKVLVYVHRFTGMSLNKSGRIVRHFASTTTCYPLHLLCTFEDIHMQEDSRYVERERKEEDMNLGAKCAYVGPEPKNKNRVMEVYGSCGVVLPDNLSTPKKKENTFSVRLKVYQKPLVLPKSLTDFAAKRNWTALAQVATNIGIEPRTLSTICSSLLTTPQFGSREIGLCLKFTGRGIARVGYAKLVQHVMNPWYMGNTDVFARMETETDNVGYHLEKTEKGDYVGHSSVNRGGSGTWYMSHDAQELIAQYVRRFRPLIDFIDAGGVNTHSIEPPMFMTGKWAERDAEDILTEVEQFIAESGIMEVPMIAATEETFTRAHLRELEAALVEQQDRPFLEKTLSQVGRNQIYVPVTRSAGGHLVPLPIPVEQAFHLGARVVNCRATGSTPFGLPGTIVRLLASGREAEVVYDQPFTGGTRLDGRLADTRAAITKLSALLVLKGADAEGVPAAAAGTASVQLKDLQALMSANGVSVHSAGEPKASMVPLPRSATGGTGTPASATAHLSAAREETEGITMKASSDQGINLRELAGRLPQSLFSPSQSPGTHGSPASGLVIPAPKSVQKHLHGGSPPPAPAETAVPKPRSSAADRLIPDDYVSGRVRVTHKDSAHTFRGWMSTFTKQALEKALAEMDAEARRSA